MKIWDSEKNELIEETSLQDIETGLSIAEKLLNIVKKLSHTSRNKVIEATVLMKAMQEETQQKQQILTTILELRKIDKLSAEEFKLLLVSYNATSKF